MNNSKRIIALLVLQFLASDIANAQEGTSCHSPDGLPGLCINIKSCSHLLNLLKTYSQNPDVINYLRKSTCGFNGSNPLVCCSIRNQPELSTTTTTQAPIPELTTPTTTTASAEAQPKSLDFELPKAPNCGFSNHTAHRIVGGTESIRGEFPWMAALGFHNARNPSQPKWLCGGTLITKRHILTAAHCAIRNDLYIVRLGEFDLYDDNDGMKPIDLRIVDKKLHEGYVDKKYVNDIALLTLEKEAIGTNIAPICLPTSERLRSLNLDGYIPIVSGWGSTYFRGPSSAKLLKVFLPVVSEEVCAKAYSNMRGAVIDHRVLCAGETGSGKDSCQGDSGGPFMYGVREEHNGKIYIYYHLVGVVSYGIKCADPGYYGVYTRVTAFLDWIENNVY